MHEQATAKKIMAQAQEQGKVRKITVECGELAHLPATDMEKVLKEIAPYEVEVIEKAAVVACPQCEYTGKPRIAMRGHDFAVFFCEKCGAVPNIVDGQDIILTKVEVGD